MPYFSQLSKERLHTCDPELQLLFTIVIKSFDCSILCGYRSKEDQDKAFEEETSKLEWPNSKHNSTPSQAVDVCPYPVPDWSKPQDFIYFGGYVMGVANMLKFNKLMTHSIRYGGDFNSNDRVTDSTFGDFCHFELIP